MKRESRRLVSRPLYLFCMVIAPLFCYVFFTTLMDSGLPVNMPVGVVDQDMTSTSRQLMRNLDAFEQTAIVAHYPTINEARAAMQKGEIYGFLGPNGAGKTTVMKLLTSLWKPAAGSVELFGESLEGNPYRLLGRMGSIIEFPVFFEHMTGGGKFKASL